MWQRLRRFKALEPKAQRLFLRAITVLPLVSLSLRLRGFGATQASLQKNLRRRVTNSARRAVDVTQAVRMVRAAVRYGFGRPSCLETALTLWWLLARQDIDSQVRIGTRKSAGQFQAHAWVECNGQPLNEPEEGHQHYAVFDATFPVGPSDSL